MFTKNSYWLGIDIGSISCKAVLLNSQKEVVFSFYEKTYGDSQKTLKKVWRQIFAFLQEAGGIVMDAGATGAGKQLIAAFTGVRHIFNEILAHSYGALHFVPTAKTIIEIGGQDSKLILIRDGTVHDFALNTICAAGTGSFLDQQRLRFNLDYDAFISLSLQSQNPVAINGGCAVFAESDMLNFQQLGFPLPDILAGLHLALARNFLANLGKGKKLESPIVFQGGVSQNQAMQKAFSQLLNEKVETPPYPNLLGAVGAALLTIKRFSRNPQPFTLRTVKQLNQMYVETFHCQDCPHQCAISAVRNGEQTFAYFGDRCGKWSTLIQGEKNE